MPNLADRKPVAANEVFFNDRDGSSQIVFGHRSQQGLQALPNGLSGRLTQPDQEDSGPFLRQDGEKVGEVKIRRQNDPLFPLGILEDFHVPCLRQADIPGVDSIVPLAPKPQRRPLRHRHIQEELHSLLGGLGEGQRQRFFTGQPSGVLDDFPDILRFQVRILPEDFFRGFSRGQKVQDQVGRDPKVSDAGLPSESLRINGDSWKWPHNVSSIAHAGKDIPREVIQ